MHEEELIKDLRKNFSSKQIDKTAFGIRDILYTCGSPLDALVYSRLLWPEFVDIEGRGGSGTNEDRRQIGSRFLSSAELKRCQTCQVEEV